MINFFCKAYLDCWQKISKPGLELLCKFLMCVCIICDWHSIIFFLISSIQVHCLQFLIYEVVSGGNLRRPGGLFGNSGSEIPVNDLKQLETFFYKLGFFLHILDYSGNGLRLTLASILLLRLIFSVHFCVNGLNIFTYTASSSLFFYPLLVVPLLH